MAGIKGKSKYQKLYKTGHKFTDWTLLEEEPVRLQKGKSFYYHYIVECKCGLVKPVDCTQLVNGVSKGCVKCGAKKNRGSGNPNWKGYMELPGYYFNRIKVRAKEFNREFSITKKEIYDLFLDQNGLCALSGQPIEFNKNACLDRIDSNLGYTIENVQWLHKDVNLMKNHFKQEYFINICKKITDCNKEL